jgi:hypothetical protein
VEKPILLALSPKKNLPPKNKMAPQETKQAFTNLIKSRIELDYPRKSGLLAASALLKDQGLTVFPFPEFQSGTGRALTVEGINIETLSYTRSDALNVLMAFAGNEETGELLKGSLVNEVKQSPEILRKITGLRDKLVDMPPINDIESQYLFYNGLTTLKVKVPLEYLGKIVKLRSDPNPKAEAFKVPIDVALNLVGQIVDQLSSETVFDQMSGEIIKGKYAGLIHTFYDQDDASYLVKMLNTYIN